MDALDNPSKYNEMEPVPQECLATGISFDFLNEFMWILRDLDRGRSVKELQDQAEERSGEVDIWTGERFPPSIRTYFERYVHPRRGIKKSDLINSRSANRIPQMDKLVGELNQMLRTRSEDMREQIRQTTMALAVLVRDY